MMTSTLDILTVGAKFTLPACRPTLASNLASRLAVNRQDWQTVRHSTVLWRVPCSVRWPRNNKPKTTTQDKQILCSASSLGCQHGCPHLLLSAVLRKKVGTASAAVGRSAAKAPATARLLLSIDRADRRTLEHFIDHAPCTAYYAGSVNNGIFYFVVLLCVRSSWLSAIFLPHKKPAYCDILCVK